MSSSSSSSTIPNLSTFRGAGSRGRGRGGLRRANNNGGQAPTNRDLPIQQTDQDASVARMSAVQMGYLEDAFAGCFVPAGGGVGGERRMPVINRGTYVRTTTLDQLLTLFLTTFPSQPSQILSLGAGSDTRFFRLLSQTPTVSRFIIYHELDFPLITSQKTKTISQNPRLLSMVRGHAEAMGGGEVEVDPESGALYSEGYNIHPVDLRELAAGGAAQGPQLRNLNPRVPTLIISECLLCYLPNPAALLTHLTTALIPPPTPLTILIYEPLSPRPPTPFSLTMTSNLSLRNLSLTLLPSLPSQLERLISAGFESARAGDVEFLWERWVGGEEKRRVGGLEMLDEVEEWKLMGRHYCVVWGWRAGEGGANIESLWGALPSQERTG
ncbi:MAG: carboxy methyl transferase for protein phosphatase 2A [Geoglossum umbratile]|nr:MAG: carboxy methyl transferase for protein phosphatase 2A [Geoglossum umbratile]